MIRSLSRGAISLFLCLFVTGCALWQTPPEPLPIMRVVRLLPPEALASDCREPRPLTLLETNDDLLRLAFALADALADCTADKRALRAWMDAQD